MSVYRELAAREPDGHLVAIEPPSLHQACVGSARRRVLLWCVLLAAVVVLLSGMAASAGMVAVWMVVRAFHYLALHG